VRSVGDGFPVLPVGTPVLSVGGGASTPRIVGTPVLLWYPIKSSGLRYSLILSTTATRSSRCICHRQRPFLSPRVSATGNADSISCHSVGGGAFDAPHRRIFALTDCLCKNESSKILRLATLPQDDKPGKFLFILSSTIFFVIARLAAQAVAIYCVSLTFEIATAACALVRNDNEAL